MDAGHCDDYIECYFLLGKFNNCDWMLGIVVIILSVTSFKAVEFYFDKWLSFLQISFILSRLVVKLQ